MKIEKLNCICAKTRRRLLRTGGLLVLLVAALLMVTPALAADQGIEPAASLANKPEVTIQGNVVVDDNGNPTGFYELALCVRSPKRIYGPDPSAFNTVDNVSTLKADLPKRDLSEAEYAQVLADIASTDPTPTDAQNAGIAEADYTITYYPFSAASAVVGVNADVLTAVNWDVETVTYGEWDKDSLSYKDPTLDGQYPRGVDKSALDPAVWGLTDPEAFPDVSNAYLYKPLQYAVALDTEGDRSAFGAAAQAVHYYEDVGTNTKAVLVTLSGHVPGNKPVIYKTSTPVVVIRFSYDLQRFPKGVLEKNKNSTDLQQFTGGNTPADAEGFWLGLNRATGDLLDDGKTPVTWLADTDMDATTATTDLYSFSDELASETENHQVVWTKLSSQDTAGGSVDWSETEYYYYLGAFATDGAGSAGTVGTQKVNTGAAGPEEIGHILIPATKGATVLAVGTDQNPVPPTDPADPDYEADWTATAPYSFYRNILFIDHSASTGQGRELKLRLVNQTTFRAPRGKGTGGNQILFYDWDDTLIGSLIVGDGDVRQAVNTYVEQNLVHPDLRAGDVLKNDLGGTMPDFSTVVAGSGGDDEKYMNLINSLDREYTYRGQYPSTPSPAGTTTGTVTDGEDYPLTNKLDYAFYKHLNTVTSVVTENTTTGKQWTENYFTLSPLTDDPVAAQYPWAYGWAIVEDGANATHPKKANWPVMVDSAKIEDTWTTFGVGELENMDPSAGNLQSGFAALATGATATPPVYPGGLSADWSTDPTRMNPTDYTFMTSSADANGYLRFADFSDMSALLKDGQDVIIVKAVYEPGTDLIIKGNYTVMEDSDGEAIVNVTRLGTAASTGNSIYAFDYQYQRVNTNGTGNLIGVGRAREPAVRTGFVYDAKAASDDMDLSKQSTFFLKNVGTNSDIMDIQLTAGGALWKVTYTLLDIYGLDISNGTTRSVGGELDLKTGFEYDKPDGAGDEWTYDERQGTDGFVVQATLNTLLAEATKEAKEPGTGSLEDHISVATLRDLNFKRDTAQTEFTTGNMRRVNTYLQDLVDRLYANPTVWNANVDKNGNIVLGWHQIQQHIIMCEALTPGTASAGIFSGGILKSEADCIAIGYEWCRLDTCGGNATMPLNSIADILKAIDIYYNKGSGDANYKPAEKALFGDGTAGNTGISASDLKAYGFRTQADGVPYDSALSDANLKAAILADLKDAVTAIGASDWSTVTWADVQEAIITANMTTAGLPVPTTIDMWWQPVAGAPNGTPPAITNWADLLKYSFQACVGVDTDGDGVPDAVVPDAFDNFASTNVSKALLDYMIKEDVEGVATGEFADMGWLRKDADASGVAVEFADADEFKTEWLAALAVFKANGIDTVDKLKTLSWEQLQYTLITKLFKSHNDILDETSGKVSGGPLEGKLMYWNDGGQPKLDYATLLDAISDYYFNGDATKLDALLAKGINPVNSEVYLRKDDTGAAFTDANEFKTIVYNALRALKLRATNASSFIDSSLGYDRWKLTWSEMQWLLIHYGEMSTLKSMKDDATIAAEHAADSTVHDYWWYDGGAPNGPMPIRNINELFTAYFWTVGTSTGVSGQNADALNNLSATIMQNLNLRGHEWGIQYDDAVTSSATLIADVSAALAKMPYITSNLSTASADDLTLELQYLLLNPSASYKTAAAIKADSSLNYWWLTGDGSYPTPTTQEEILQAAWKAFEGFGMYGKVPEAEAALKKMDIAWISKRVDGLALRKNDKGENFDDIDAFVDGISDAVIEIASAAKTYDDLSDITQRQLQWLLLGNTYDTDANVENATIDNTDPEKPVDAYWWFTSDTKPSTGGPTLVTKPLDESRVTWDNFMYAAWNYSMSYDPTDMDNIFPTYDETLLNVDFLLRQTMDEDDVFTDYTTEFYDQSWMDKVYAVINMFFSVDRSADFSSDSWAFDVAYPNWYEFQYMWIHYDEISVNYHLPSLDEIKEEAHSKYTWRFTVTGGGDPADPGKQEKPLDESKVTWNDFMYAVWNYSMSYDPTDMDNIFGVYDESILNDDFLLRQTMDEDDVFTSYLEFYDQSWSDKVYAVINMFFSVDRSADFSSDSWAFDVAYPNWYEFQYMWIHYDEISVNYHLPSLDEIKKEAEEKYTWRFETTAPVTPPSPMVEKDIDESRVTWDNFMYAAWNYAMSYDPTDMDNIFPTYDATLLNDDFLLRKSNDKDDTFSDYTELYDGSWGDKLYDVINMFFSVDRSADFSSDSWAFDVAYPSWYEFQYMWIHYDEISVNYHLPSLDEIKEEVKSDYSWKYETVTKGALFCADERALQLMETVSETVSNSAWEIGEWPLPGDGWEIATGPDEDWTSLPEVETTITDDSWELDLWPVEEPVPTEPARESDPQTGGGPDPDEDEDEEQEETQEEVQETTREEVWNEAGGDEPAELLSVVVFDWGYLARLAASVSVQIC